MTNVLLCEPLADQVSLWTLNRPERRNALSLELLDALCTELDESPQLGHRVVLIQGAGAAFCTGLDLGEAADPERGELCVRRIADLYLKLATSPVITIALAHGAAYAGGAGLMASCDFVLAAPSLKVAFPEVRRGLVPALVGVVLSGRIPTAKLRELFVCGEPVSVDDAVAWGLVNKIVPEETLRQEGVSWAATIVKGAPQAVRETKRHLTELQSPHLADHLQAALERHLRQRGNAEAQEGIAAFRERREPNWDDSNRP